MKCISSRLRDLFLIAVGAVIAVHPQAPTVQQLRYALFISGPDGEFDASGSVPAIELAEEVLKNKSVLDGYELRHSPAQETLCHRSLSLNRFFATVPQATPPVLGLLGCGCSVASEPVAEIIHHWNISQIAYDSSAVLLSNRERFINFFRTHPSDMNFAPAMISFLQYYGWKKIMFITQQEAFFITMQDSLSQMFMMNGVMSRSRVVPHSIPATTMMLNRDDFFFPMDDFRVIFVNTYSDVARVVMCEAMKAHDIGGYPQYVWITYAWYQDEWWTSAVNDDRIRCSEDELVQILRLSIGIEILPVPDNPNAQTDVGLTTNMFDKLYEKRLEIASQENNYTFSFIAPIAYDAVWSLALALNRTITMLEWPKDRIVRETRCQDDGKDLRGFGLADFTYNHSFVGCIIRWSLTQTRFTGVSGLVTFDKNGTREQAQVLMLQYRQDSVNSPIKRVIFGDADSNNSFEYVRNESNSTVFPDGIPLDGTPMNVTTTFHLSLVIIYDFLAFLGLIFTTICLTFNFMFRKRKIVRLTSPNLNYFIIAGSYIMYSSIFIRLIPSGDETVNHVRCNLEILLTMLAYCLAFGTILVKVGRVHHIFNNPTERRKKPLTDWHLAVIVAAITGVGVLMAILSWSIPQLRSTPALRPDDERPGFGRNEEGIRIRYVVWQCSVDHTSDIVNIILFVYLGFLQLVGVVLALRTRKVKIKVLNDAKYIITLVYISSIVLILIAIIRFTVGSMIHVTEVFYSGGLLVATTVFLSLTFIPKMISLYRDPQGVKIFSKNTSMIEVNKAGALSIRNKPDKMTELEERIKELETRLKEKDKNICESTESFNQDRKSTSMIEDKEQVTSSGRNQESSDSTNHYDLSYRKRDKRETSIVTTV